MAYTIEDLDEEIDRLLCKRNALIAGVEFCDHHFNGCDCCYECYCTGCGKHICEIRDEFDIPFKKDAYCSGCRKTPNEKEEEKEKAAKALENGELSALVMLKAKYPNA